MGAQTEFTPDSQRRAQVFFRFFQRPSAEIAFHASERAQQAGLDRART